MSKPTITQADPYRTLELWFFRECNEGTRRHLFALLGYPVDEITNHGRERICLNHFVRELREAATLEGIRIGLEAAAKVADEWMQNSALTGDCSTEAAQETGQRIAEELRALDPATILAEKQP